MGNMLSQAFPREQPPITEKNTPNQSGRVHFVTGGYTGVGLELCKMLYAANARVYIAGRSQSKADLALRAIKAHAPTSTGTVDFIQLDLADLKTIAPAISTFHNKESRIDCLTLNAGVMFPPAGSKDAQGEELMIGTNCLGSYLVYKLLRDTLLKTAESAPSGSVRVTWAASSATAFSPKGGLTLQGDGRPKVMGVYANYGQSKTGNVFLAAEGAKHDGNKGVIHVAWNPGNLKSELQRHVDIVTRTIFNLILYPAIYGAYTEIYAALSPDITLSENGAYILPWGQIGKPGLRGDIIKGTKSQSEGGSGVGEKFVGWVDSRTAEFAKL